MRLKVRLPPVFKAVCAQPVRRPSCINVCRLHVHGHVAIEQPQGVASLCRFPVIHPTQLGFELPDFVGVLDLSLSGLKQLCLGG